MVRGIEARRSPLYNRTMKRIVRAAILVVFSVFALGAEASIRPHTHPENNSPTQLREMSQYQSSGTGRLSLDVGDDLNLWQDSIAIQLLP
jgi:hypothetical protein